MVSVAASRLLSAATFSPDISFWWSELLRGINCASGIGAGAQGRGTRRCDVAAGGVVHMRLPLASIAANEIAFQYTEGGISVIDVFWLSFLLEHCSLRSEAGYLPLALFTPSLRYLII